MKLGLRNQLFLLSAVTIGISLIACGSGETVGQNDPELKDILLTKNTDFEQFAEKNLDSLVELYGGPVVPPPSSSSSEIVVSSSSSSSTPSPLSSSSLTVIQSSSSQQISSSSEVSSSSSLTPSSSSIESSSSVVPSSSSSLIESSSSQLASSSSSSTGGTGGTITLVIGADAVSGTGKISYTADCSKDALGGDQYYTPTPYLILATAWSATSVSGTVVVNGTSIALSSNTNIQEPIAVGTAAIEVDYSGEFTIKIEAR